MADLRWAWLAVGLAAGVAVLAAGCGGSPHSSAATTDARTKYTPAPASSAIPCATPSSPATTAPPGTTTWTGVFEKVDVQMDQYGGIKGTPIQHTRVSAVGNGPVTVSVPVTATRLHTKDGGRKPKVVDQEAQVTLDPNGTAVQEVKSKFANPLPVTVAVTYTLDGKPVIGKHIGHKDGMLGVKYKLTNTTSHSVSACFEGFNGKQQHLTVSTPLPLVASLSLTVPSQATSFSAPGASLSSARKGVSVGWTESLFEPLGPTTQTFTLSMKMTHVSIPKVTLYVLTVDPKVITGSAPAKTTTAIGNAAAAQAQIVASVQHELDALQKRVSTLVAPPPPSKSTPKRRTASAKQTRGLTSAGRAEARGTTRDHGSVASSLAKLTASVTSLLKLRAKLAHKAAALGLLATQVRKDAAAVKAQLNAIATQLEGPVQNATLEVQQLEQLQADLGSVSPSLKSAPTYGTLASDLQVAQSTATQLQTLLASIQQRLQSAAVALGTLQGDLASLKTAAAATSTLAAQTAAGKLEDDVTAASERVQADAQSLQAQLTAAKASLARTLATEKTSVNKAVAKQEAALQRQAAAQLAAARKALAKEKGTARATVATDAKQALSSIQASLEQTQAQLTKADTQIQSGLATANQDYARILALNELAILYQLPGGSAPGVTTQNGRFHYTIG